MEKKYVGAIDQGTTSSRFILFNKDGQIVSSHQEAHHQIFPRAGWVEHDPLEIWERVQTVITQAIRKVSVHADEIASIGITNQRETTVVWNKSTGKPYYNAIVWQDTRTHSIVNKLAGNGGIDRFRDKTGLPLATYFSGPKLQWILENHPHIKLEAERGEALFGTMDSYIIWWLTGGPNGGAHVTDITNASRTMMMDIGTLQWDDSMLKLFGVPAQILPEIRPSIAGNAYGITPKDGVFQAEIPVCGSLGDQQAALFGQACYEPGASKNTYGTGCFLLMNTGDKLIRSQHGLITTPAYQIGNSAPVYALEGSIAYAGASVQWLRDKLQMIKSSAEIEEAAQSVEDSGGVYFVPAFSGLFAPYWRSDARGVLVGLTGYANRGHIARAVLESTAFQTREIFDAMQLDSGMNIPSMKVDGGMVVNDLLMQFQADILGVPVIRPQITETTCLGAAYAAGLSVGFWKDQAELAEHWHEDKNWQSQMEYDERAERYHFWKKAVQRSLDWIET